MEDEADEKDPVLVKAQDLAQQEMAHIAVHEDEQAFVTDIGARILSHHKCIVVLEAPTSKTSVLHSMLKLKISRRSSRSGSCAATGSTCCQAWTPPASAFGRSARCTP